MARKRLTTAQLIEAAAKSNTDGCLIWPRGRDSYGYGMAAINRQQIRPHRAVCIAVHGEPPTRKHHAAHVCGNKLCVNPKHIRWRTPKQNNHDKRAHGTWGRKLSANDAREIFHATGLQREIAARYGVVRTAVADIKSGRAWSHVTGKVYNGRNASRIGV